jgi:hypothetical protein
MKAGVGRDSIAFEQDTFTFNYPGTPSDFVGEFRCYYGPTMNAFAAAEQSDRAAELQAELEALFASQNTSPSQASTCIPATFLRVTVTRE